jgi:hypothetical protein
VHARFQLEPLRRATLLLVLASLPLPAGAAAQERPPGTSDRSAIESNEIDDAERGRPSRRQTAALVVPDRGVVKIAFGEPRTGGREHAEMESLAAGEVVRFFDSAAIKLATDVDLLFGETRIRRENVAPGYQGVYSLWLARAGDGWELLFNEQADVWGTQHDPVADVARVPLRHEELDGISLAFSVELAPPTEEGGPALLVLRWGQHRWTAPFHPAP